MNAGPTDGVRFGTVVLTGATSGIGAAAADRFALCSRHLVLLGRESEHEVAGQLARLGTGRAVVDYVGADYTELNQVRMAAARVLSLTDGIDLLVNDAGMPGLPDRVLTADGNERTFQVNVLGAALLTRLLLPAMRAGARIVNVGSSAHRVEDFDPADPNLAHGYSAVGAYARSKGALVAWSMQLADRLRASGINVVALCPGLNDTPLSAAMTGGIGGPPANGAALVVHAATSADRTGGYAENGRPTEPSPAIQSPAHRRDVANVIAARLQSAG